MLHPICQGDVPTLVALPMPSWPSALRPQQTALPLPRRAHVSWAPAPTASAEQPGHGERGADNLKGGRAVKKERERYYEESLRTRDVVSELEGPGRIFTHPATPRRATSPWCKSQYPTVFPPLPTPPFRPIEGRKGRGTTLPCQPGQSCACVRLWPGEPPTAAVLPRPSWPLSFLPQQTTPPPASSAHVW